MNPRNPPRLAVVTSGFPRTSETFAIGELTALAEAGVLARIYVTKPGDAAPPQPGVQALMPLVRRLPDGDADVQAAAVVDDLAGAGAGGPGRIDGLHGYFAHHPADVAARAASRLGVPYSFSVHALDARRVPAAELAARAAKAVGVVACNSDVAAAVASRGVRPALLPHGVDLERFAPRPCPGSNPGGLRLLAVGRLVEKKGFRVLLEAVARLRGPWTLRLVGSGPEQGRLEEMVRRLGLGRAVELLGRLSHEQLPAEYAWADVIVLPSVVDSAGDRDGLPNVALEAMASGRAVLASDVAALGPSVRRSGAGLVVPPEDPEALATALTAVTDPARRAELGAAGRAHVVAHHDLHTCARRFVDHLTGLHARHGDVAYVLKGYPRLSEVFITSEVHRLERLGVRLRLLVLKPADEEVHHDVVRRVRATPEYLRPMTSLSSTGPLRWLAANLPAAIPGLVRTVRRHPRGLARAAGLALAQALRARRATLAAPRKIYLKELLLAVDLVDRLDTDTDADAGRPRHLHAHFAHGTTTVTWLAGAIAGLPFSFTGHAKDLYQDELNPAGLLRRKLDAAEFVVTCTTANAEHLSGLGSTTPVHVVHHGLNADIAGLVAGGVERVVPERVRLLAVGRLVRKKGLDTFVDACALLRDDGLDFDAVVAGESGDHEDEVRRRVELAGLADRVRFAGPLTQRDLFEQYRRASVFALPCRILEDGDRDGIPNVLMEAMACGLPVVSTGVSGITELVEDGVNGLVVEPDRPAELADALHRLVKDPGLARTLGEAGRQTVADRFDADANARRMAALLADGVAR